MANHNQITIDLITKEDRDGKKYYLCFPDLPVSLRLDEVAIFVFTAEDGQEQLVFKRRENKSQ